ncbi:RNA-binding domain-containing protein [Acrodontium crateriforme]|uniref:Multiple RNA-binding domain-containing protein 1 n=1 Tax=Acrodontium crateriforme TaxID=150365 RepID=A0AAQ3RCY5_9PEZI|nr:RNA-binding domain-containing protein [Acrodontium crateriforme]
MADLDASSRIFVKGLPPTFTEAEFRKHFGQKSIVTDAKIFPNRRIGYVGFKTPEDARKAVKYFNKTFIRMSRIGVELARPVQDARNVKQSSSAPTAQKSKDVDAPIDNLKRKRPSDPKEEPEDPKLKEFLDVMKPKGKKKAWESDVVEEPLANLSKPIADGVAVVDQGGESDEEYELIPKKSKRAKTEPTSEETMDVPMQDQTPAEPANKEPPQSTEAESTQPQTAVSDADWARSRTSRLLGLLDDDEEEEAEGARREDRVEDSSDSEDAPTKGSAQVKFKTTDTSTPTSIPDAVQAPEETAVEDDTKTVTDSTMRLFVRNLPYDVNHEDLESQFSPYGNLEEIHIPMDKKTGKAKGFALVQFTDAGSAEKALEERDGQTFQGRLLHILPASAKRETKLNEFELSKLPLKKQQQIKKRRDAETTTFNWNALYMNADAVVSSVADRLGIAKSEVLDPTSSDAAVKQAHAETHIIQETKAYFKQQGVDLDSFKKSQRGDTAILVKNIPYDCGRDELQRLFEEHGDIKRLSMPPSGVIAIVEFANAAQCKAAFSALAYRKVKSSVLFLEKAPKDVFGGKAIATGNTGTSSGISKASASELKNSEQIVPDTAGSATLFVRNLNFSTSTTELTETFKPLSGFLSARVKTRTDPKKPGQILSMGFGFLEFKSSQEAESALRAMDGYNLAGHKLQIRASHKGADAAEERRKADAAKRAAGKHTKIIIKNLPFEATKKDIQSLFGAYGQLRSVRVPKKMDRAARGFAFADFTTPKEAESAMDALKDTHLLGRRLVLDFASEDAEDAEAEIEKMQKKVGAQVNKMALQKLTSGGRKKFTTGNDEDAE